MFLTARERLWSGCEKSRGQPANCGFRRRSSTPARSCAGFATGSFTQRETPFLFPPICSLIKSGRLVARLAFPLLPSGATCNLGWLLSFLALLIKCSEDPSQPENKDADTEEYFDASDEPGKAVRLDIPVAGCCNRYDGEVDAFDESAESLLFTVDRDGPVPARKAEEG